MTRPVNILYIRQAARLKPTSCTSNCVINSCMDPARPQQLQYTDLYCLLSYSTYAAIPRINTNDKAFHFTGISYFNARFSSKAKRHQTDHLVSSVKQSRFFFFIFSYFISKVCSKNNIGVIFHIKITMKTKHRGHRMLTVIKHKSLSSLKMHSIYCHMISLEDKRRQTRLLCK